MTSPKNNGFYTNSHHLIEERVPPPSIIELRQLIILPENSDIFNASIKEPTFEEAMGCIAAMLDIALDGYYDVEPLAAMLCKALVNRGKNKSMPHLNAPGLVNVEMVEREKGIILEERGQDEITTITKGAAQDDVQRNNKSDRYTVCDSCVSTFDCISNRTCAKGTPAC